MGVPLDIQGCMEVGVGQVAVIILAYTDQLGRVVVFTRQMNGF